MGPKLDVRSYERLAELCVEEARIKLAIKKLKREIRKCLKEFAIKVD